MAGGAVTPPAGSRHTYVGGGRHDAPCHPTARRATGTLVPATTTAYTGAMDGLCSVDGCDRTVLARGWCRAHYKRWSKYGDPTAGGKPRAGFWSNVDKRPDGCWIWTGSTDRNGYGVCSKGPGQAFSKYAHRRSFQMLVGPVPDGLSLDHLCRNPPCVNPDHLEPVTQRENVVRGLHGVPRTHCPHGHPYDEENTYVYKGRKHCRECNRQRSARYNRERRRKG